MSTLFSPRQQAKPTPTQPPPTIDDARERVQTQRATTQRRGRAATELVRRESNVTTAAKQLTGN